MRLGVLDALLQNLFGLLDELPVQIDRVGRDAPVGVVLAEDKLRRLSVILLHLASVGLALLGELFGGRAIAARVGFFRLVSSAHSIPQRRSRCPNRAHTLPKQFPRLEASWRARSRSRSYSASASPLWSWLKADRVSWLVHVGSRCTLPLGPRWDISNAMVWFRLGIVKRLELQGAHAVGGDAQGPEKSNQIPIWIHDSTPIV